MSRSGVCAAPMDYAVTKAHLVPAGDFHGRVHSLFDRACNLRVGDSLLVAVHDSSIQHSPTSVRVSLVGPGPWSPVARPGDTVSHRSGVLAFGAHLLDLRRVPVWAPELPPIWRDPRSVVQQLAFRAALCCQSRPERAARLLQVDDEVAALRQVLAGHLAGRTGTSEQGGRHGCVGRLLGLDAGLAPAGDDIVVGLLAVLSATRNRAPAVAGTLGYVQRAVLRHAGRTTDVSAHYLRLAAGGHFSEALGAVIAAVLAGSDSDVSDLRVRDLVRVRATSGADALRGLLPGFDLVLDFLHNELLHDEPTDKKVVA